MLFAEGRVTGDVARFQTLSGGLTATRDGDRIVLDFPARPPEPVDIDAAVVDALGARPAELHRSNEGAETWSPFDRFAQFEESKGKSVTQLLEELAALRKRNLATLAGWELSPGQLELTGSHPDFGKVTLAQLLATWAAHDLSHCRQIARVTARQYAVAVGPWRDYMPVMDD